MNSALLRLGSILSLKIVVLIILSISCFAQDKTNYYPNKSVITHQTAGFVRDPANLWVDEAPHVIISTGDQGPDLFLTWKIDKSDFRKDADGYSYYQTKLLFGFQDQDEFYELPYTFHAGTGDTFRRHCLAYYNNTFYLLVYDLIDEKTTNLVLFKFSKEKGLASYIFTSNLEAEIYPTLDAPSKYNKNHFVVSYYNRESQHIERFVINENFLKENGELDAEHKSLTTADFERGKGYKTTEEMATSEYGDSSDPDYDYKAYIIGKKTALTKATQSTVPDKQNVKKYPTKILAESEKDGWKELGDWYNRNPGNLIFQYKTDLSDFKTDSQNRKYYKTGLRFGFSDDSEFYELPSSFYLLFSEEQQNFFYSRDFPSNLEFKPPCLLFADGSFYIFVPNYINQDNQEGTLFTYRPDRGLIKEILFTNNTFESGWFAYFTKDADSGFALIHVDNKRNNLLKTYLKNNQWITNIVAMDVKYSDLQEDYRDEVKPYFLVPKPEPYEKISIDDKLYFGIFSVLSDFSIFTNSEKDKKRLAELQKLKPLPADFIKIIYDPTANESSEYRLHFDEKDLQRRTGFEEVPRSKIEVSYIPETKAQSPFDSCESYAFGALYKQFIDSDWQLTQMRKKDPSALVKETDISFFGMQQYFRGDKFGIAPENLWMYSDTLKKEGTEYYKNHAPEFDFEFHDKYANWFEPFEIVLQNENNLDSIPSMIDRYFFERAKPADFSPEANAEDSFVIRNFKLYFEKLYEANKNSNKDNSGFSQEIEEIHKMTGMPVKNIDLQKAFAAPNLYAFYYSLFFSNSPQFIRLQYRDELVREKPDKNPSEVKKQIIEILSLNKPVLIGMYGDSIGKKFPHAVLITGYKKVKNPVTGKLYDLFKMHNSWGKVWDYQTNDGWFVADNIIDSIEEDSTLDYLPKVKALDKTIVENTEVYRRLYNNTHTEDHWSYAREKIGITQGQNQKDASVLTDKLSKTQYNPADLSETYIKYFTELGYVFQNPTTYTSGNLLKLNFNNLTIKIHKFSGCIGEVYIETSTAAQLEILKSKMDFSKIKGLFEQTENSDTLIPYLLYDHDCQ